MSRLVMPGQFAKRAEFYFQLAQFISAGLPFSSSLAQLERNPPHRDYREPVRILRGEIESGRTLSEGFSRLPNFMPLFDLALVQAGESSGRLDMCFRLLASYYEDRARLIREFMGALAYPFFLLHFAVFLLPFPSFFLSGNIVAYLGQTVGTLLPLYAVIAFFVYAGSGSRPFEWRLMFERLASRVPVFGRALRGLALARLSAALEALLAAGVTVIQAWELAVQASGSAQLQRTVETWRKPLEDGHTPGELVRLSPEFPEVFASQYATGEISGSLEQQLSRLHRYYQDESTRGLRTAVLWLPRMFYIIVVLAIAYKILSFWSGYFNQVGQAGGF